MVQGLTGSSHLPVHLSITCLLIFLVKLEGWTWSPLLLCLRARVACHKIQPIREKNQSTPCMCFSVNYVPAYLHVHTVCVQVYTYLCLKCVCVCACWPVHVNARCVYPWKLFWWEEGWEVWTLEIKSNFFYTFRVGANCLSNFVSSPHLFQHWCLGVLHQTKQTGPNKTAQDKHWWVGLQ